MKLPPTFVILVLTRYQISSPQEQLVDLASIFHPLNREVVAKETSIDLLIEKGAMLLTEGWFSGYFSKRPPLCNISL